MKKLKEEVEMIGQDVPPLTEEEKAFISAFFQKKLAKARQKKAASGKRAASGKKSAA